MPTFRISIKKGDIAREYLRDWAPHSRGSRGRLRALVGSRGNTPVGVEGAKPPNSWASTALKPFGALLGFKFDS